MNRKDVHLNEENPGWGIFIYKRGETKHSNGQVISSHQERPPGPKETKLKYGWNTWLLVDFRRAIDNLL